MTSGGGGGTSVHGLSRNELSGEIILSPEALLVSEDEVIQAPVDDRWEDLDDPSDPPFSTRGLSLVNFSTENRRVDVSIENSEDSNGPLFAETYDLDAEHGRTELEVLDGPGEYEVGVSTDEGGATHQWSVSENPRELTEPYVGGTHDVGLGIYVLPDGAVEIHEVPEGGRPSANGSGRNRSCNGGETRLCWLLLVGKGSIPAVSIVLSNRKP